MFLIVSYFRLCYAHRCWFDVEVPVVHLHVTGIGKAFQFVYERD